MEGGKQGKKWTRSKLEAVKQDLSLSQRMQIPPANDKKGIHLLRYTKKINNGKKSQLCVYKIAHKVISCSTVKQLKDSIKQF